MKTRIVPSLLTIFALLLAVNQATGQGTTFTYQGRLDDSGSPANGSYDITFTLFDALTGGSALGTPVTNSVTSVSNGLFMVALDFGNQFDGNPRYLEIAVATNGGSFATLDPRQSLLPAPYAMRASSAGIADSASAVASGAVVTSVNGLKDDVTLAAGSNVTLSASANMLTISSTASGNDVWGLNGTKAYYTNGNVGIGTTNPGGRLTITGVGGYSSGLIVDGNSFAGTGITIENNSSGGGSYSIYAVGSGSASVGSLAIRPSSIFGDDLITIDPAGNVGIGNSLPAERLSIAGVTGYSTGIKLSGSGIGGTGMTFENTAAGGHRYAIFSAGSADNVGAGGFGIFDDSTGAYRFAITASGNVGIGKANPTTALDVNGVTQTKSLSILGGADLAEPFRMSDGDLAEGSVVVIDERNPGRLKLSTSAYDTRVAGIVSGANGVQPGISLQQTGSIEGGQNVALSGRVYVLADASRAAIKPGDLLTTSDIPGRAMRVRDHVRAQGAILGKAMTGLKQGRGMVLVLVTLQ